MRYQVWAYKKHTMNTETSAFRFALYLTGSNDLIKVLFYYIESINNFHIGIINGIDNQVISFKLCALCF
jgi:hypothetical protein